MSFRNSEEKVSKIESLPDDIVFNILVRIPAQYIYKDTRRVCRKWYKTIHTRNFMIAHDLRHSTCGLVIQSRSSKTNPPVFVVTGEGQLEISNFDFVRNVLSTCNGLILVAAPHFNFHDLCIMNPATKQLFALPSFFNDAKPQRQAIAYDASSKFYKVICTFYSSCNNVECAILTVGVDRDWIRRVDIELLPLDAKEDILTEVPLATDGFVHWVQRGGIREKGEPEYVLTLDVGTEIIKQFPVPLCDGERLRYYYLSMGSFLYLMIGSTGFTWVAWEMNPESGEWTKLTNINLEAQRSNYHWVCLECRLLPVGWLKFREVLVFSVCKQVVFGISVPTRYTITYNVCTRKIIDSFELESGLSTWHVHRNSLAWLVDA